MSNSNPIPPKPINPAIPQPPFHPGPPFAQELGVMFGFIVLFVLILVVYYYAWLIMSEWEAKMEWKRRERLASMGIGVVPVVGGREGGGSTGWREKWRWSGIEREGKKGKWGGGMVMSTGAGHGGGEMP
ncbi:MAG: hypothetical protein Q9182_002086 [Xanthomendoza sp. 2 TL-2023]